MFVRRRKGPGLCTKWLKEHERFQGEEGRSNLIFRSSEMPLDDVGRWRDRGGQDSFRFDLTLMIRKLT